MKQIDGRKDYTLTRGDLTGTPSNLVTDRVIDSWTVRSQQRS